LTPYKLATKREKLLNTCARKYFKCVKLLTNEERLRACLHDAAAARGG
jgi:hypothetical protein